MEASFSPILCWSQKKKKRSFVSVLQLFSAISATYQSEAPWTAVVYGFWREKKRRNSQNFSAKMPEKILHFFALIGNTGLEYLQKKMGWHKFSAFA